MNEENLKPIKKGELICLLCEADYINQQSIGKI